MTTALSTLRDDLSIMIGDYYHYTVTTAINADTSVVCTTLDEVTSSDDYFNDWYIIFTSGANDGTVRKIEAYADSTNTITVHGAALTDDGATLATFELHKYSPNNKLRAINRASRELYPVLHKPLIDETLIGGNILPTFHWASSSTLDFYTEPTGTLAKTTTAGYYRHSLGSAKVTASGANDAIVLDSNAFPRLLDIMGNTVSLKCWALAEVANDAVLDIVTTDSAGSDTTQSSTTTCSAGVFTLLEIEDYDVPDNITRVQVKLRVKTDTKYVYFDPPRLTGKTIYQYVLPYDFQKGHVSQVRLQSTSYSGDACDDLHPRFSTEVFGWNTPDDEGVQYLDFTHASQIPSSEVRMQLRGYCPLEDDLSSDTDTMTLEAPRTQLLLSYAIYLLYEMSRGTVSSDSVERFDLEIARWLGKVEVLKRRYRMYPPQSQIHWLL